MRISIISHGHPELVRGGAEQVSYSLFQNLKSEQNIEPTYFARTDQNAIGHEASTGLFRGRRDEVIFSSPPYDSFRLLTRNRMHLERIVRELVEHSKPDIVHIHHYFGVGLDLIDIIKSVSGVGIVLTLHEYIPICNNIGQMVKSGSRELCDEESYTGCASCFSEYTAGKFFLRKKSILARLNQVDAFVAPSGFLRDRYVDWGLDKKRVHVIDGLLPKYMEAFQTESAPDFRSLSRNSENFGQLLLKFGFFGQVNPFKGTDVLLEAARLLPSDVRHRCRILLFGNSPGYWGPEFTEAFERGVSNSSDIVTFAGEYKNEEIMALMRKVDWTLVPSTWWENSPVVIQEAKAAGRPILCSNIGGMKEKVHDGVDGMHFLAGSAVDLASKMTSIALGRIKVSVQPMNVAKANRERLDSHLKLYKSLLA